MPNKTKHQLALELVNENRLKEAADLLAEALGEKESAELWNDWATLKIALDENHEALAGYDRALELEPDNAQAMFNFGVLLMNEGKTQRGIDLLEHCQGKVAAQEQAAISTLLQRHKKSVSGADFATTLDDFAPTHGAAREYFSTHRDRYLACLELLPQAIPGQSLLELGASFHHLTPALESKGYRVHCSDIWDGGPNRTADLKSRSGEQRHYKVDNFDIQQQRWPYDDASFDVVVFCEMLEHLNSDPVQVLSEINRVLKQDGLLLLTTPNIASAKSFNYILEGKSPYVFGQYVPGGLPTDRHNREFTASEIDHLFAAAGFQTVALETNNSWWKDQNNALAKLVAMGQSIAYRGDNVMALGRKTSSVQDRYPEEFYCGQGSQTENRNQIEGSSAASIQPGKNILLVHDVLPHFDRSGSDMRLMQVIRRLIAAGHYITYIARNGADRDRYEAPLKELGVKVFSGDAERLPALGMHAEQTWKLETVLQNGHFDAAIFFHWFWSGISVTEHYLDDVRKFSPATKIVVLTDDRHGIREWRMADLSNHSTDRERALDFLVRETCCYRAADLVLAITEDDRRGLLEMVPDLQIELLPMTADTHASSLGFDDRHDFVFLANFDNLANRDATAWFCDEIWPRIRKRMPEAKLHIAGNNIPSELSKGEGIELLGHVASLEDTLEKYRVFISPIRFGTGIKTKNLTALGNGIPLITTTIGAEGMGLTDGENAIIEDSAGAFANKAIELHNNRELWQKLAANGPKHIETEFSVARLDAQIAKLMQRLDAIVPVKFDPEHRFSVRLVEELHPEVLTAMPPQSRNDQRVPAYVEIAERLAGLGHPSEALEQVRHIFYHVRGAIPKSLFFARILTLMEKCYRELGDQDAAERCGNEAKLCLPELNAAFVREVKKKSGGRAKPSDHAISVIIPTFNRKATLRRCLEALKAQTLSADEFEVIVVDDGSTDDTQEFLARQQMPFRFTHYQQKNQGAGAARRFAVAQARGEYLLLMNDDTIAEPQLLQEHLQMQRKYHDSCFAVLGTFDYERPARRRALTHFLSTDPFMFPQKNMHAGWDYGYTHFITCNLSIRRDAVVACGSFDSAFRLGEDTELGIRLSTVGCKVVYHPQARALHDHLEMRMADMVLRAKAYGPVYLRLLEKHPTLRVVQAGITLKAPITAADIERVSEMLAGQRAQIEEMVRALAQYDNRDLEPFFATRSGNGTAADVIVNLFRQAIPQVHWFYVFDGLCAAWREKHSVPMLLTTAAEAHV
jgi:glycosyltransferase involved in cell wall biosynthesis/2-polyprenyl-3-methyl-5-hydroxy-6-metoxy-1,4-benzoquinol methylase